MNRKEFLEILRSQLAGHMQEGKAAAHVRYYEDYVKERLNLAVYRNFIKSL